MDLFPPDIFHVPKSPAKAPPSQLVGTIQLRWCQKQDIDALMYAIECGYRRLCCVAATGYGKGPMIAEMVGRLKPNGKVVCLVDRAHLVHQLADEIERHLGITVGRVADGVLDGPSRHVVVGTVQAFYTPDASGKPLFAYTQFENTQSVLIDEGHKFLAPAFRSVADHFVENASAVVVGFTATPVASNGGRWTDFWDWTPGAEGPCMRTVRWCIHHGLLVPPIQAFVGVELEIGPLYDRLKAGEEDLDDEDAGDELATLLVDLLKDKAEQSAAKFAAGVADIIGNRRAIIFAPPRVQAAKLLSSWLNASGRMTCDAVWGNRGDKSDRLAAFKRGTPQALSNVALLCEGFNDPTVSATFVCRMVKQWRLLQQMVGRALRPHPSIIAALCAADGEENAAKRRQIIARSAKPDALIADLVGLDGKVLQASAVEAMYGDESPDVRDEMGEIVRRNPRKQQDDDAPKVDDALREAAKEEIARKQSEQLASLVRKRAMAGDLQATVQVTYGEDSASHALPNLPTINAGATLAEKAVFVAYATQYDLKRAMGMVNAMPRNQIRGMTAGMRKKMEKENKRPDWNRARQAFPEWAAQKGRVGK